MPDGNQELRKKGSLLLFKRVPQNKHFEGLNLMYNDKQHILGLLLDFYSLMLNYVTSLMLVTDQMWPILPVLYSVFKRLNIRGK